MDLVHAAGFLINISIKEETVTSSGTRSAARSKCDAIDSL